MSVSAVIIAGNEEQMLPGCLATLGFADEIVVVVDRGSTDRTATIAQRAGARVLRRKFDTFAKQKNFGIKNAQNDWVLVVDADERITPELGTQIKRAVREDRYDGYQLTRINVLFGKELRHGGWKESLLRLIRKKSAVYRGAVHEHFDVTGLRIGRLKGEFWHLSHRNLPDTLKKTIQYGDLWAAQMVSAKHPPVRSKALLAAPAKTLWRHLGKGRGYRDGIEGTVAAGFAAFGSFYAYAALWNLQRRPSLDETYRKLDRKR